VSTTVTSHVALQPEFHGSSVKPSGRLPSSELFTSVQQHAYVPSGFCSGIIIPLPEDKSGDLMDSNNYRGITLGSNITKLLELCLLDRYSCYLLSSDQQFGFKKKLGCNNAVYKHRVRLLTTIGLGLLLVDLRSTYAR